MSSEKTSVSRDEARKIMGKNFFGVEECLYYFNYRLYYQGMSEYRHDDDVQEVPFSAERLTECKDTHFLVTMTNSISIMDIYRSEGGRHFFALDGDFELFLRNGHWLLEAQWDVQAYYLVPKVIHPGSIHMDEAEFIKANNLGESLRDWSPDLTVLIIAMIGNFLLNKEKMYGENLVMSADHAEWKFDDEKDQLKGKKVAVGWEHDRIQLFTLDPKDGYSDTGFIILG